MIYDARFEHMIPTWYHQKKIMIYRQKISCPVSCRVGIMFWYQWYMDMIPEWHDLGYEMTNNLYLSFIFMISLIYLSVSCDIMWYHVVSCDIQYHVISAVSCVSCDIIWDIMWYHVISSVWVSPTSAWEVLESRRDISHHLRWGMKLTSASSSELSTSL